MTNVLWRKSPSDIADWEMTFDEFVPAGDSITAFDVAVSGPDNLLVVRSTSVDASAVTVWFTGGTAGATYVVSIHIVTAGGRDITRNAVMSVGPIFAQAT